MTDNFDTLPEEYWPEIHELPGELSQLAQNIEEVAPGMGVRLAIHLVGKYGSTPLYFHTMQKFLLQVRNKKIIERYDNGERVVDIARDEGLSSRHLWNILGNKSANRRKRPMLQGEDKQLKLF